MTSPSSQPTPDKPQAIGDGLRVAVVGARRTVMGTGGFLARQAHASGAEIVAIVCSNYDSARAASEELLADGMRPEVYAEEEDMLAEMNPDVVIIASPTNTHIDWIQQCLDSQAHVFCEKPLSTSGAKHCDDLIRAFVCVPPSPPPPSSPTRGTYPSWNKNEDRVWRLIQCS